jgi:hypothetical protein
VLDGEKTQAQPRRTVTDLKPFSVARGASRRHASARLHFRTACAMRLLFLSFTLPAVVQAQD